jgi:hypothetical protein
MGLLRMTKIILDDQLVNGTIASGTIAAAMPFIPPARRRARLNSGCAVSALLALPAAMSVGIMLARPAQAATTLSTSKSTTVVLSNYGTGNPFTITEGTTISSSSGDGVYGGFGTNWTLTNYGVVAGHHGASGVYFGSGGTLNNVLTGVSSTTVGTITGVSDGVDIGGSAGSVYNIGLIAGGTNDGIDLRAGGSVDNQNTLVYIYPNLFNVTGTISGQRDGIYINGGAGSVLNYGVVTGAANNGVELRQGGEVNNTGSGEITGADAGVLLTEGGYVHNGGLITATKSTSTGINLTSGGYVYNSGLVAGNELGISLGEGGSIDNYGAVVGVTGVSITGGASYLYNQNGEETGTISGSTTGVVISSTYGTVRNAGIILGSSYGVQLTGVHNSVANNGLIQASGQGSSGVFANDGLVINYGSIGGNAFGVRMTAGGYVYNGFDGVISGATGVGIDGGGTATSEVTNFGLITGTAYGVSLANGPTGTVSGPGTIDTVFNFGTILQTANSPNPDAGIVINGQGAIYNGLSQSSFFNTLTNANTLALVQGTTYGVLGTGGTVALANAGTIIGTDGSGVKLTGDGLVENFGTILGGQTGVTVDGTISEVFNVDAYNGTYAPAFISGSSDGVLLTGAHATMVNIGTVVGYNNNDGNPTGTGVSLGNGGFILTGSSASSFAVIAGAEYGIRVTGSDGYVVNGGYVVASNASGTGLALSNGGYLSNVSIGTIQGGSIGVAVGVHTYGDSVPAGIINNAGLITGGEFGVSAASYGVVNNTIGGYIRGDTNGVYIAGAGASVNNIGTITTQTFSTPDLAPAFRPFGESLQSTGVSFANGGNVYNGSGGYIYGTSNGVVINGGVPSGVSNAVGGYIKGGSNAGVILNGSNDLLYNAGSIFGYRYGAVLNNGGMVYNSGIIAADNSGGLTTGVSLTQGGNVINTSSGTIYGYTGGIVAYNQGVTVNNAGTILAPGETFVEVGYKPGIGVYSQVGGTLTNSGLIEGRYAGVYAGGTMGVVNTGTIIAAGNFYSHGVSLETGSVTNYGVITGSNTGVYVDYGNVTNSAGGYIGGYVNGVVMGGSGAAYVRNDGTINGHGAYGTGVFLKAGGTVINTGVLLGSEYGVYAKNSLATVLNTGTIAEFNNDASTYAAVYLYAGGSVVNMAGGTLEGASSGVIVTNGFGTIINAGLIDGIGYDGVSLNHGGSVVNMAAGTILGAHIGVYTGYAGASVANYGVIAGADGDGVSLYEGGSVFNAGFITGGFAGVYIAGEGSQVMNQGQISGAVYGVLANGGSIINGPTAVIYGASIGISGVVNPVNVENLNGGTIIGASGIGVTLAAGGNVTNYEGGTIAGEYTGVQLATNGTVINAGTIEGLQSGDTSFSGVNLLDGGYVHNYRTGLIEGYTGVYLNGGGTVALRNEGTVYGYRTGVVLADGGTVMNSGSIGSSNIGVAGNGGATQLFNSGIIYGADEIGVTLAAGGNVTNADTGYIYGEYTGVDLAQAGTVLNGGKISTEIDPNEPGAYNGVLLQQGGVVHNYGSGSIYGYTNGVYSAGGVVSVVNAGLISGYSYGVNLHNSGTSSVVINAGTLIGTGDDSTGVFAADGVVINQQSGVILGQYAVVMSAGTLLNSGQIDGAYSGVSTDGSLVTNYASGTITGGVYGVGMFAGVSTLLNAGTITGTNSFGVTLVSNGTVDNDVGGVISGGDFGLGAQGTVSVTNSGTIVGVNGAGIGINYGSVVNTQGGTISGGAVGVSSYEANITNAGLIEGGFAGISAYRIGVTNAVNGTIIGGINGVGIYGGSGAVTNAGSIIGSASIAVDLFGGGTVTNLAGGSIYGYRYGVSASSFASIDNSGVILAGTDEGVALGGGGAVVNRIGAQIYGGETGVYAGNSAAVVSNAGSIGGYNHAVFLAEGGAVYNMAGASLGSYGDAVVIDGLPGLVSNQGQILSTGDSDAVDFETASQLENSGLISGGRYGVLLDRSGATLTNYSGGHIEGGYAGVNEVYSTLINAGSITGGTDGIVMYGGTLTNVASGVIKGGAHGLYATYGAVITNAGQILDDSQSGAVLGDDVTLTNQPGGTIAGVHGIDFDGANSTVFNAGTIASTEPGGFAVAFQSSDVNYLTLSTGSVLDGIVDGGGSDSQIALVGTGTLGNTIQNFGTASALDVASGASWIGTGNWNIATVTNNGTFQGGQLNKPLNLTGDFVQASLATLRVVVTPTLSSQFLITGAAQLAGNLTYVFAPGYYAPHTYDFLTASDGTTGDFANVTYAGFVPPQLTHTTNATPPGANLVLAGSGLVTPGDDGVFNAQTQAMADSAQQANTSLLGKASQGAGAGSSAAAACAAEAGAAQNTATGSATTASRMASAVASAFCGAGGWIEATGTEMNAGGSGGADDYHADTGGFLAGVDKAVNNIGTRIGLAVGYDESWLHDGGGGKADVDTVRVGLYASQPIGRFTIAADVMYGHGDNHTHRATGIGQANGSYGTNIYSGAVQGSTELFLGPVELVPAAGVRIAHIASGSFAETGGGFIPAFAVSSNGTDYTSVQPFVNMGLSHSFLSASGMTVTPSAGVGFIYEAGDRGKAVDVTAGDFTSFAATHNNLDRATAVLSAGIAAGRDNWSLFAHYTAYVSGNWTSQTAEAGLQVKF